MQARLLAIVLLAGSLASCGNNHQTPDKTAETTVAPQPQTSSTVSEAKPAIATVPLSLDKDPVCGMPIKAGVEDTASYKGKVYGFCAKECKDEFLKTPEKFVAVK